VIRGQSSLEYLLIYSFALLILGSVMATLTQNQPDLRVPSQCTMSGPFSCLEHTKQSDTLLVLLQPTTERNLNVSNATLTYKGNVSSNTCDFTNDETGAGPSRSVDVGPRQQFNLNCSLNTLNNVSNQFVTEREEMSVDFRYKEDGLSFWKAANIDIII
jgi:hypothetical protein